MRYSYLIPILCTLGTIPLYAEAHSLGDILQDSGKKKVLLKPKDKKKTVQKKSCFIFKDTYDANGIGDKGNARKKKKSKSYEYTNKSRFKFKINDGSPQSNMMGGISSGMAGGSGGQGVRGGGGKGRGGGR